MRIAANTLLWLTILCSFVVISLSLYPGSLQGVFYFVLLTAILWIPGLLIAGIIACVMMKRRGATFSEFPSRHLKIVVAILITTGLLVAFSIPLRIAFQFSRSDFERHLAQAPVLKDTSAPLNQWLGIYVVEDYVTDPRGGTYFRVHRGFAGIGPDTMSYGFVYHANRQGTPYGASGYRLHRLNNDWHWFRASNDWF